MKFATWSLVVLPLTLLCFGWTVSRSVNPQPELPQGASSQNVNPHGVPVIVELFTSEGCSSCPPADALLAKLESQQPIANTQVIALEEHVDYWNNGGWMDPFSGREWTIRQEEYAGVLKNQNPYTPQIVVDGHTEFVGSREGSAREAIEKAASEPKAYVVLSLAPSGKSATEEVTLSVDHLSAARHGDKPEVWLAITEAGLHSAVSAGENAGNDLHHASVVRAFYKFASINLNKESSYTGTTTLRLNPSWKRQNLHVVAFVQEQKSRQILGAATARVEQ